MTVYVDLLFGLNAMINYLLLRGSAAMGGYPVRYLRLIGGAVIGGLYAVAAVVPGLEGLQSGLFQAVSAALMLLAAFGWKRSTVKQGLFFFALSFAFSGAVLLVIQMVEPDCVFLGGRAYYAVTTPALMLVAGLCYGLAAMVLNGWGTHTGGDLVELTLGLDGQTATVKALRDTGNTLRDPLTGEGILVAQWTVLQTLLPHAQLTKADFADPTALVQRLRAYRFRLVTYEAVGVSCGLLPAVRCQICTTPRAPFPGGCLDDHTSSGNDPVRFPNNPPSRFAEGGRGRFCKEKTVLVAFTATEVSARGRFHALIGGLIQ